MAAAAFAQRLPESSSVTVKLYGEALADAETKLVGRGVALGDGGVQEKALARGAARRPAAVVSPCGADEAEIVWREVRRETDPQGGTHVFYRQFVAGSTIDAELDGSEIGVHRLPDGKLAGIGGRQFDSVVLSGCAQIGAAQAVELARERVLLHKGEYAKHGLEPWTVMDAQRAERVAQTKLKLVQIDGTFRPAWFTTGEDAEGEAYSVVLDAENQRLLAIGNANPGSNCAPSEPLSFATAVGIPVRPDVVNWRSMKANVASRNEFTHEGVWMPTMPLLDQPLIRLVVYHGTSSTSTYRCGTSMNYTVFPLRKNTAIDCCSPLYDNIGTTWAGRAAGDALWNTYKTMYTFRALGRKGWDGQNGEARVVVNSGGAEYGLWVRTALSTAPAQSVRIGPPRRMYSLASSLDLVAHEWTHAVIDKTANFNWETPVGQQLHEGFADVIAMLVEKNTQGSGTGPEKASDWVMHEDASETGNYLQSGYARGAIDDDADGVPGHDWVGITEAYDPTKGMTRVVTYDDRLHRLDGVVDESQPHATGNMLSVAYLIMAAGGSTTLPSGLNPVCARPNSITTFGDSCKPENAVLSWMGPSKAGSLLFYAIQFTLTSSTTWNDVADRVVEAAFGRYNQCSAGPQYNAAAEQESVRKAFKGIGYPSSYTTALPCPQ